MVKITPVGYWLVACTPQGDLIKWGLGGDVEFPERQRRPAVKRWKTLRKSKTHEDDRFYILHIFENGQVLTEECIEGATAGHE